MALLTKPNMQQVWASGGDIVEPSDLKKQQGWTVEVPPHQFENWIQNRQDEYLAHINQRGIPAWDGLTNYEAGGLSYVQGSDGKVYKSIAASGPASVVSNPTTDGTDTYWTVAFLTQTDGDARYTQRSNNLSDLTNTATARTNIGAAPTVSPAFTGTPTAPTAPVGTDTTQLATTAFVAAAEKLNAPIATIAAAATINLTTGAPNTSQLAISGTGVNINGFTVADNRFFIVKMTGASNTLVNSVSLVTGRGSNIPVVAGDTFLMRSTASNTVEIVGGDFLIDRAVGSGQTWQAFTTPTRSLGVTYTNTTGRPILVSIAHGGTTGLDSVTVTVGGVQIYNGDPGHGTSGLYTFIVPPGAEYSTTNNAPGGLIKWSELR